MRLVFEKKPTLFNKLCEYTSPLNLISKESAPMLKVKELDALVLNLCSMSELFTGVGLPFESCQKN